MTRQITRQNVLQLASGACFFGAGGGGALATGQGFAHLIPEEVTIPLVTVQQAASDPDRSTAVVIYLGAPSEAGAIDPTAALAAFDALDAWTRENRGQSIGYLVPGEMGSVNATLPFVIALERGLSVIDGDGGGGRSLPVLPLASFSCFGVGTNPSMVATSKGATVQVNVADPYVSEDLILGLNTSPEFGGFAGVGLWLMSPDQVTAGIPTTGTVTRSIAYGEVFTGDAPNKVAQIFALLEQDFPVYRIRSGTLEPGTESDSGGFDVGTNNVQLASGTRLTIVNQNENLILWDPTQPVPAVLLPDSVNYLGEEGQVFSNVEIAQYAGQTIYLVGIRAPSWMHDDPLAQKAVRVSLAGVGYYGANVALQT